MGPVTVDTIVADLSGVELRGAVQMPNNAGIALVFANGLVLSVRMGFLHSAHESEGILEVVRRSLAREAAALQTLGVTPGNHAPESKAESAVRFADAYMADEPTFLPKQTVAEAEGHLDAEHSTKRQRAAELLARQTPDV